MASLTSSTQLLHDGSEAIGNTLTLIRPSIDGPQQNSAAGRAGDRARRQCGEGGVWTGGAECLARPAPTAARRPPWPRPRPHRPGAHLLPPPCPAAAPGLRAVGPPESVAASAGTPTSRPRRPRAGSGFPGPHTAPARPATALTSVDAACTPSGTLRAAAGLGELPAAWVPPQREDPRNVPKPPGPRPRPPGPEERSRAERVSLDAGSESRLGSGWHGLAKAPQPHCSSDVSEGANTGPLLTHGPAPPPAPAPAPAATSPFLPLLKSTLPAGAAPRGPRGNQSLGVGAWGLGSRAKLQLLEN